MYIFLGLPEGEPPKPHQSVRKLFRGDGIEKNFKTKRKIKKDLRIKKKKKKNKQNYK